MISIGDGVAIAGVCTIVFAAIWKRPQKINGYITRREFKIWCSGFDERWKNLNGWIEKIQQDVEHLRYRGKERNTD